MKLQYFGHMMQSADSLEKTLMLGKIDVRRRRQWQRMTCWMASLTQWTWVWASSRSWWWTGNLGVLQFMWLQRVGHNWVTELNSWDNLWCEVWLQLNFLELYQFPNAIYQKNLLFLPSLTVQHYHIENSYVFVHVCIYIPELAIMFWGLSICDEFHLGFIIIISLLWLCTMPCM